MKLYTFGDSHGSCGSWTMPLDELPIESVRPGLMGPITMSKVAWDKPVMNIQGFGIQDGDIVVFAVGEIDCRIHLVQPKNFPIYKDIIDDMVPRYLNTIQGCIQPFNHLITMIYNVPPPIKNEDVMHHNPYHPHLGTNEQRKEVVLYMNNKLKEYCKIYNFIFFDVYDKYSTEEGYIDPKYSIDVHIENPIYIVEFLKDLKLESI